MAVLFCPYRLTSKAVQFDVSTATCLILEKYGLWDYVENKQEVIVAATVDGGKLAWKLTQISAGILTCHPRAINPLTIIFLFGESGDENLQSPSLCFPLYVHVAKGNSEFCSAQLAGFFQVLNKMEDQHVDGLKFSQGADMCSLQNTLCPGK